MILSLGTCKTYIVIDAFCRAPEVSGLYRLNQFKYSQVPMTSSIHKQESMCKTANNANLICSPFLRNLSRSCVSMLVLVAFCTNTFLLGKQLHLYVTAE